MSTHNQHDRLKEKARSLDPLVRIGKNGLTQGILEEIKTHLKKRKLVKIKMIRSSFEITDKDTMRKKILEETGAELISQIGFTLTIYKR